MSVAGTNNKELLNYQFTQRSLGAILGSHCNIGTHSSLLSWYQGNNIIATLRLKQIK